MGTTILELVLRDFNYDSFLRNVEKVILDDISNIEKYINKENNFINNNKDNLAEFEIKDLIECIKTEEKTLKEQIALLHYLRDGMEPRDNNQSDGYIYDIVNKVIEEHLENNLSPMFKVSNLEDDRKLIIKMYDRIIEEVEYENHN